MLLGEEVYGHSATVVGGTVWVLGGKNQCGKRLSVPGTQRNSPYDVVQVRNKAIAARI